MSELNLILLGPPGAGKGTQAERLRDEFELPHISTGDILRQAVADGTELGQTAKGYMDSGELVPDEVIIGVIIERLGEDDARDGFLLDGFPRTIGQADALADALGGLDRSLTAVLLIEVPDEEIVKRISGRRVNPESGRIYHVDYDPPREEGVDDVDGTPLIQREDDKPETVRNRPDLVQRFVDASIVGWVNYLHGNRKAANALMLKDNPEMTEAEIEASVALMKSQGIVDSGEAASRGIGAMSMARIQDFHAQMVKAGLYKPGDVDLSKVAVMQFVNKGVGQDVKAKPGAR